MHDVPASLLARLQLDRGAFNKIKNLLRRAGAWRLVGLDRDDGTALSVISSKDAQGFSEHTEYRPRCRSTTMKYAVGEVSWIAFSSKPSA